MEMSPSFHFTGGEPFLRDDLFDILGYVRQAGFSISLMSNGTLITADMGKSLKQAGVSDVQVSLDGMEAIHDSIRGRGSFKKALRGIENLLSLNIDANTNLTLSRLNIGEVDGLFKLAKESGISAVTLSRMVVCGRGQCLGDEMLDSRELAGFYRGLHRFDNDEKVALVSRDPLYTVAGLDGEIPQTDFPVGVCAAGVFGVTITADGGIMPCRRMDLTIGNIREQPFRRLWAESPVLWSLRERQHYHDGCESCRYWAVCRGCRAVALAFARMKGEEDYLGIDPQCPYYTPRQPSSVA